MFADLLQAPESHIDSPSQFDFHHRPTDAAGAALVILSSPDCGSCRQLRQVMHRVKTAQPRGQLFEVDAQRDLALTPKFEAFHLQTVFLFLGGRFRCQLQTEAHLGAVFVAMRQPAQEAR